MSAMLGESRGPCTDQRFNALISYVKDGSLFMGRRDSGGPQEAKSGSTPRSQELEQDVTALKKALEEL